jgi:ABC-type Fe3+ transport system substrate-binding protein
MNKICPATFYNRLSRRTALATSGAVAISTLLPVRSRAAAVSEVILTYKGADREQRLIQGATQEGQLVLYSAMIENQALRPLANGFQKKYPFINMNYWRGDTEAIIARISTEVRAGNVVGDVIEGTGVGALAVFAGIVTPHYSPLIKQYPVSERDPSNLWTPTRLSYFSIAYNTNLVPADKVPKSYEDLLDPQWKGKMAWVVDTESAAPLFVTNLRLAWGETRAMAYFEKLKTQNIINFGSGSARTLVDRTLAGEYSIALNIFAHHPLISRAEGAPVNSQLMDPVPTTAATMAIPKGVPHPYSAMLLIDYILSTEGQSILAQADYFPARPDVPPLPMLAPIVPKTVGIPENFINPDTELKYTQSSQKVVQTLFR